ncbi:MAG TPA: c-type cytochrome, partial [Candidatus Omnitrophota bacterium]|nr:c-type cytochrome [Candidatus Omnitrophota bacterium]
NFDTPQAKLQLTPNAEGLLFVPERGGYPIIHTPNDEFTGERVHLAASTPELDALIAYLQKIGTNRGKWRDVFEPQRVEMTEVTLPRSDEWIAHGKAVYERRCIGCHGKDGDGNGPAATFMHRDRPRNFTLGLFKFQLTPSGSLPSDGDLLRTITRGVRGTAMPSWHELREKDRLAVVQYIKYHLAADRSDPKAPYLYFVEERPKPPLFISDVPPPSAQLIKRGAEVWQQAKCWECHGREGRGDGEKAAGLKDDTKFSVPPANLTLGQFKSGPAVTDIFRTMSNGLPGTPMPSYSKSLPEEDRWALSYFVLSLSAFRDPISGAALPISPADRMAISDPALPAATSQQAYAPTGPAAPQAAYAGAAWATRHGVELVNDPPGPEE